MSLKLNELKVGHEYIVVLTIGTKARWKIQSRRVMYLVDKRKDGTCIWQYEDWHVPTVVYMLNNPGDDLKWQKKVKHYRSRASAVVRHVRDATKPVTREDRAVV